MGRSTHISLALLVVIVLSFGGRALYLSTPEERKICDAAFYETERQVRKTMTDLACWKLQLPIDTAAPGSPDEIKPPAIETYSSKYFGNSGDTLRFRAYADGKTTSGTKYPRSELRELEADGSNAAWSAKSGRHVLTAKYSVGRIPKNKPHVVVAQIHDGEDDVMQVRLEGSRLFVVQNRKKTNLSDTYKLGTWFKMRIQVKEGRVKINYDDAEGFSFKPSSMSNLYFKTGMYLQSNRDHDDASEYGEVLIRGLKLEG